MSNYAIRTPRQRRPFLWTTSPEFAEKMARKSGGEVLGPLPDEEAHTLGMAYFGRFAEGRMIDSGKGLIYLP